MPNNLKIKNYTDAPEVEIQEGLDVVAVNESGTLNRIPIENFSFSFIFCLGIVSFKFAVTFPSILKFLFATTISRIYK